MNNYSREDIEDMLAYLDLHIGRYQYKVLTTDQKNMLADLVDASCVREAIEEGYDEPRKVHRWWQCDLSRCSECMPNPTY